MFFKFKFKYQHHSQFFFKPQNIIVYIFRVHLEPRWTIVPNLLHFGWNSQTYLSPPTGPRPLILPFIGKYGFTFMVSIKKRSMPAWSLKTKKFGSLLWVLGNLYENNLFFKTILSGVLNVFRGLKILRHFNFWKYTDRISSVRINLKHFYCGQ